MSLQKILLLDIETAPNLAYVWGKWEQNVVAFKQEWCILSYAAKWLDGPVFSRGLPDTGSRYPNDRKLLKEIHALLDKADIVCGHFINGFDVRKINARFLFHGQTPPSPYKTIDTKQILKRYFALSSNKLDDVGEHLGLGKKIKVDFSVWLGCMQGDSEAWKTMLKYNARDVELLEKVYLRLRPYIKTHPIISVGEEGRRCPKCGSNRSLQNRGLYNNSTTQYRRFRCRDCGGYSREIVNINPIKRKNRLVSL